MKILFAGASGMLGKPVARELINAGYDITLLARNPGKVRSLFPGIRIVKGDVLNISSLRPVMRGMDAVYCNLSVAPSSRERTAQPEREGIDNILAVAKETGVKRIAYISSLVHRYEGMNGFHWWAFRVKQRAVQQIRKSGLPYTIFYPSTFMETFPNQMLRGNKLAMPGKSIAPMWFIAASDYGKQVAASFRILSDESKEYAIQGPASWTFEEGSRVFAAHYTGSKLGLQKIPMGLLKLFGIFIQKFNYAWHICEALNKYPEQFESGPTWKELGKPAVTLPEYAASL